MHRLSALAAEMDTGMARAMKQVEILCAEVAQVMVQHGEDDVSARDKGEYAFFQGSLYYKLEDDGLCAMWASGHTPVDRALQERILRMEPMQSAIRRAVEANEYIGLAYFISPRDWGFVYPFFNPVAYFEPGLVFKEVFKPYNDVMPDNNPSRESRWIQPYQDIVGQGYIVSASAPVYVGGTFTGSVGVDFDVLAFLDQYLDRDKAQCVIAADTLLVRGTEGCEKALGMKGLKSKHQLEQIWKDIPAPDTFRLVSNGNPLLTTFVQQLRAAERFTAVLPGGDYEVTRAELSSPGWFLVELNP